MISKTNSIIRSVWWIVPVVLVGMCLALLFGGTGVASPALAARQRAPAEDVITIGVEAALSHGNDFIGVRQANAVQLAVDEINAAGGVDIGGTLYTVALVMEDSECNPNVADDAAQALVDAGVVAVVGDTCSGSTFVAQEIFDTNGIPMVTPSATSPQITEGGYDTTFRVVARDDSWTMWAADSFWHTYAMDLAAIIMIDGFWGNWTSTVFTDIFETTLSGTITSVHTLTSPAEFTAALTQIQSEGAHVIYFPYDDGAVAGQLALEAYNLGMLDTPVAWNSMAEPKSLLLPAYDAVAGPAAEMNYAIFTNREPSEMPGYADFNTAYVAAAFPTYGDEAQMWGAYAYDAAKIILAAIDRADSTNPADIRDAIAASPTYDGVVGTYQGFDAKGDVIPQWGDILRNLNGEWLSLHPDPALLPAYTYRTDDFSADTLAEEWSWLNENPSSWSLTANPGFLRITLQQTPRTNWLVQPMPVGDFDIQTSLLFEPVENFEIAGLLLYEDDGTFLVLGRAFCSGPYPYCVEGNGIYFDHIEDGVAISDNFAMRTPYLDHAFLRLIRQGDNYTAYVSDDGVDWWLVGRHVMGVGADLNSMGLATGTGSQEVAEIYADFDFFRVGPFTPVTLKSLLPLILRLPLP